MTEITGDSPFMRVIKGFKTYLDRPIVATFGFGMTSGFPLTFVISLVGIWLSRYEVDRSTVGLFAAATSFYTWKFIWSPAIDQLPLGPITRIFGQRRGWLFTIQALIAVSLFTVSGLDPRQDIYEIAVFVALIAFLSASQDIVIDAYRIEITPRKKLAHSASSYIFGYRTANAIAGIGVLLMADSFGWAAGIAGLSLLLLPGTVAAFWAGEPDRTAGNFTPVDKGRHQTSPIRTKVYEAVVLPFKEFTGRQNWIMILAFIFLFKAGDAMVAIMTGPLIVDLGYTNTDIAYANKLVGVITLLVGVGLGSVLYQSVGMIRSLLFTGVLMMLTNLVFAWLALSEVDPWRLAVTIGMENFATGLAATVTVAYLSSLCNVNFTATQYALLSSLGNQARTLLGTSSGFWAEYLGWVDFFIASTFLAVPGLVLLWFLWRASDKKLERPELSP